MQKYEYFCQFENVCENDFGMDTWINGFSVEHKQCPFTGDFIWFKPFSSHSTKNLLRNYFSFLLEENLFQNCLFNIAISNSKWTLADCEQTQTRIKQIYLSLFKRKICFGKWAWTVSFHIKKDFRWIRADHIYGETVIEWIF